MDRPRTSTIKMGIVAGSLLTSLGIFGNLGIDKHYRENVTSPAFQRYSNLSREMHDSFRAGDSRYLDLANQRDEVFVANRPAILSAQEKVSEYNGYKNLAGYSLILGALSIVVSLGYALDRVISPEKRTI